MSPDGNIDRGLRAARARPRADAPERARRRASSELDPDAGPRPAAEPGLLPGRPHGRLPGDPERPLRHLRLQPGHEGHREPDQRRRLRLRARPISPDGQWLYYSSVQGTQGQDLPHPAGRRGLARADHLRRLERRGRLVSPDGKTLYFASDRVNGIYNIYSINLENGETTPLHQRRRRLLLADRPHRPATAPSGWSSRPTTSAASCSTSPTRRSRTTGSPELNPAPSPAGPTTIPPYQPPDRGRDRSREDRQAAQPQALARGRRGQRRRRLGPDLPVEHATSCFGDNLGDRKLICSAPVGLLVHELRAARTSTSPSACRRASRPSTTRYYYLASDTEHGRDRPHAQAPTSSSAATSSAPIRSTAITAWRAASASCRASTTATRSGSNADDGVAASISIPTENNFPTFGGKLVGDTAEYESFGPISGRPAVARRQLRALHRAARSCPGSSGPTLTFDMTLDLRHYFKITRRSLHRGAPLRLPRRRATCPTSLSFGGLDTLRALPIYGIIGNTAAFLNVEFRFPLIDFLVDADPRDPGHPRQGVLRRRRRRAEEPALPVLVRLRRCAASAASASRAATARRAAWPTTGSASS